MNKKILILASIFFTLFATAQNKKLTLDESVLQQNRQFRADKLAGFQWIPNTNKYVYYTDNQTKMVSANAVDNKTSELVSLADVNAALKTKLKSFTGLTWIDANTILVTENGKYFTYSLASKSGATVQATPSSAENVTFDNAKQYVAFTEKNNLYFIGKTKEKIAVTDNANEGIVSGQSIARNEFGISNGIFWSPKSNFIAFYQKDQIEVTDYPLLDITETPGKLENIKYPMIGQKSEKPRVGIYNLATNITVYISPKGNQDDYLTNVCWTPDENYILIAELNRGQNDMNLNVYDAKSGKFIRTLLNEKIQNG